MAEAWSEARPSGLRRASTRLVSAVLAGWGVRVTGLDGVPKKGAVIFAGNHVANLDGPLVGVAVAPRRWPRFMGKVELFRLPVLGAFLRGTGCIPLDRKRGDVAALRSAEECLLAGESLAVFPEGTRGRPGQRRPAKPGVGYLAARTGAPVVPVKVLGTDRWPLPGGLEVRFGTPMAFDAGRTERAAWRAFAETVMGRVYTL